MPRSILPLSTPTQNYLAQNVSHAQVGKPWSTPTSIMKASWSLLSQNLTNILSGEWMNYNKEEGQKPLTSRGYIKAEVSDPPGAPFCLEHPQLGSSNIPHCRLLLPETPRVPLLKSSSMQSQGLVTGTAFPKGADCRAQEKAQWAWATACSPVVPCDTHPLY